MSEFWKKGLKSRLSERSGVSGAVISRVLHRKEGVGRYAAIKLERIAKELGLDIPLMAWLYNRTTSHPAFYGKPAKEEIKKLEDAQNLR